MLLPHSDSVRSPSGRGGGLRAARSSALGPFLAIAAGTEEHGAMKLVTHPAHEQFAVVALLLLEGFGCAPHYQAPQSRVYSRAAETFVAGFFFFFFF